MNLAQSILPRLDSGASAPRPAFAALRAEVRAFISDEIGKGFIRPGRQSWTTYDRPFSRRCAERGYVAMTWPKEFGGHERSPFERYVVCEELLAAGAPLGSHWIADRQSGPQILRHGRETLRQRILPRIAAGDCTFGIGMSEPDSGSDLSSIRTRASRADGGWRLEGRKVWTTNAQHAEYLIVLCRTEPRTENRYAGLSQLVVPLDAQGVSVRPIVNIAGEEEFNEVVLDGNFVPDDHLLGQGGDGWKLVTEELAFERSGPDRILSTFGVLSILVEAAGASPDRHVATEIGRLVARMTAIRQLSLAIADRLAAGKEAGGFATIMKDLGTTLEQEIPDVARRLLDLRPSEDGDRWSSTLATAILHAPCFSLRGGTREILKGMIARELGLPMSDTARMLDDTVDRMLRKHLPEGSGRGSPQVRDAIRHAALEAGLPLVFVSEDRGGLGAALNDACVIAWRWGYHAAPFPIVETMLAGALASLAGSDSLADATVCDSAGLRLECSADGRKLGTGTAAAPATGPSCAVLVIANDDDSREMLCVLDSASARAFRALSGEPWLDIATDKSQLSAHFPLPPGTGAMLRTQGALLTASAMTGAMARMIEIVIEHANTRVQFGRPLGKFQAVQNLIAEAASEQVVCQAVLAAAVNAFDASHPDPLLSRSAKAQAGRAATIVSAAAHQVLGAIGFTEEHVLGHYSRRLWDWRDHWGRQTESEEEIGRAACADPRGLWSHLVDQPSPLGSFAR